MGRIDPAIARRDFHDQQSQRAAAIQGPFSKVIPGLDLGFGASINSATVKNYHSVVENSWALNTCLGSLNATRIQT
jgi:hypothetical protein